MVNVTAHPRGGIDRRAFGLGLIGALTSGAAFAQGAGQAAGQQAGPRLAAIDWAMAETAMELGVVPVAMAELLAYRRLMGEGVPDGIVDLGLRGAPNFEALSIVAPDLILSSSYYSFAEPGLARIAPVFSRALYVPGEPPLPKLIALITDLARALGREAAGAALIAKTAEAFRALSARAARFAAMGHVLFEMGDARHIRVYGTDSLFGGALGSMGLVNDWADKTAFAFTAPVPLETLAQYPQSRFILIGDIAPQTARALSGSALWQSLAPVRAGRVVRLPELNGFGGVTSALRFARALCDGLEARS